MVEESDDGTGSFSKRGLVDFFFVGGPGGPAFPGDALPFVGECADGGVMAAAFVVWMVCRSVLPEAVCMI